MLGIRITIKLCVAKYSEVIRKMKETIDLKALERKAYLAYHDDGLQDMGIGAFILHTVNHFITLDPVWDVWQSMTPVNLLLGIVMLGNGYMLLRRFKEKYPLTGEPENE